MKKISEELKIKSASIDSLVHENSNVNLKRNLFWNLNVEFIPFIDNEIEPDTKIECSISCEWMVFGKPELKDIKNELISYKKQKDLEASFYIFEHLWIKKINGEISYIDNGEFELVLKFKIKDKVSFSKPVLFEKEFKCKVIYEGLLIIPENFDEDKPNLKEVKKIADTYSKINQYEEPVYEDNFRYRFKPIIKQTEYMKKAT